MNQVADYPKLIDDAKTGNYRAYNTLCIEFLDYVPLIIDDLKSLFSESHMKIDSEDVYQIGYLAICEELTKILHEDKNISIEEISDRITKNIVLNFMNIYLKSLSNIEEPKAIRYKDSDSFKSYVKRIQEASRYSMLRNRLLAIYSYSDNPDVAYNERKILLEILPVNYDAVKSVSCKDTSFSSIVHYVREHLKQCIFKSCHATPEELVSSYFN